MWLTVCSPTRQVRDAVEDVAMPPRRMEMRGSFPSSTSEWLTAIAQGPCGPSPRTATSPPSSTTTPPDGATSSATRSTTSALALAPRSSEHGGSSETVCAMVSRWIDAVPIEGTASIHLDTIAHTDALDPPCSLDLGASAKALVVDLVADDVAPSGGVVVELGGDVAVRGEGPQGPWAIAVSHSLVLDGNEPRISMRRGGIATSSTASRTWRVGEHTVNHIVDPRTGRCAQGLYTTATVSASDCVLANSFATAALLWNEDASYHIAQAGWSARLVRGDGSLDFVGGWPEDTR